MKSLTEAGKETQRKESRNQFNDHSSPLPTGALRVRETDAQRARESDREAPTDRHTRAHALTHMHAHRHGRNVRTQANSEVAERQARGKPPSPASLRGCSHPAPHPQLTTKRVRLGTSITAPSVPGPAGLGGGPNCPFPQGLGLQAELLHVQTARVYLAQRCGKDCPPHSLPPTGGQD